MGRIYSIRRQEEKNLGNSNIQEGKREGSPCKRKQKRKDQKYIYEKMTSRKPKEKNSNKSDND